MAGVSVPRWRERTLPQIVDDLARDKPNYAYGCWLVNHNSSSASVHTITYAQLCNVVDQLAWWLIEQLGRDRQGEVLTYVGSNDVRFTALVLATIKTGFRLFLTSPRNSPVAHRKLFDTLKCRTLITPDPSHQPALAVLEAVQACQCLAIPSIDDLLQPPHRAYIMEKSLIESYSDTLFIIHTSGSTGIPKPLNWTQETAVRHIEASSRDPPDGLASIDTLFHGKRVLSTLPPFHGAGLLQHLLYAIPFGNITVIPSTTGAIVTAHGVVDALKKAPAHVAVMVPSIVAELAQNPELLDYCAKNLQLILYIGGDLPQAVGDIVASRIPLRCWWGASEVGMPQQLIVPELGMDQGGWHYIRFHPCAGATFDEVSGGLYELVISRDDTIIDTQTTFTIGSLGSLTEYRTRDLFEPHPKVPNTWRWRARADDIIVFLNGEKTNPVSMEQYIVASNSDAISGAVIIGAQRFQAALIIDPSAGDSPLTTAEQASLIERIWPSVDDANKKAPAHARVEKSLILVAQQPFIRSGKGTIQRAATVAQYTAEIDNLYAGADISSFLSGEGDQHTDVTDVNAVAQLVRNAARAITGLSELSNADNFFGSGMDSLQALRLVRAMRKALSRPNLALSTVYQNPTPLQLAASVLSDETEGSDDRTLAGQLLSTYRGLIQKITRTGSPPLADLFSREQDGLVDVLLTGSTGTLGTSILHALLGDPRVSHVFCLNRSADGGRATQYSRFAAAQLDTNMLDSRVTFLQADLVDPKLGLDEETYRMLGSRVGLLVHNAWPVNFNLPLLSFRPMLAGLVNLVRFAAGVSLLTFRIAFISSVSVVLGMGSTAPTEAVPDERTSLGAPLANGYARSKFLAEVLCDSAAQQLGLHVVILRIGQVAGSTARHGAIWNRAEWLPSLVISSARTLNCLPNSLGPHFSEVDWVPSDLLGAVVRDITLANQTSTPEAGAEVFNVRNPRTTSWDSLIPTIQEAVSTKFSRTMQVVSHTEWLARLQESERGNYSETVDASPQELAVNNPAVKLLNFYRHGLWPQELENTTPQSPMVISRAVAISATLHDMPSVSPGWMEKWIQEWIYDEEPVAR
ncbi:putative NRPS-like enzyme [Xylaria castorea]|nr:putative NRPS-like enzyme [Xylaria castorea]